MVTASLVYQDTIVLDYVGVGTIVSIFQTDSTQLLEDEPRMNITITGQGFGSVNASSYAMKISGLGCDGVSSDDYVLSSTDSSISDDAVGNLVVSLSTSVAATTPTYVRFRFTTSPEGALPEEGSTRFSVTVDAATAIWDTASAETLTCTADSGFTGSNCAPISCVVSDGNSAVIEFDGTTCAAAVSTEVRAAFVSLSACAALPRPQ